VTLALVVGLACAAGAVLRYAADRAVTAYVGRARPGSVFPWGTLAVNLVGCVLLGLVAGVVQAHGASARWETILGTGLAGGLSTFSTWTWETLQLLERRSYALAALNAGGSLVLGAGVAAVAYRAVGGS
jgi:CrcB protein